VAVVPRQRQQVGGEAIGEHQRVDAVGGQVATEASPRLRWGGVRCRRPVVPAGRGFDCQVEEAFPDAPPRRLVEVEVYLRQVGPGDIVITADIPLAARALAKDARVLNHKGQPFTDNDIGSALALRSLMDELRQGGTITGGPAAMTQRDRSRFLSMLDEMINAVRRAHPPAL